MCKGPLGRRDPQVRHSVRLTPIRLTLNLHCHIHTQAREIPILVIVARSHSHLSGHTHTQSVILTLRHLVSALVVVNLSR